MAEKPKKETTKEKAGEKRAGAVRMEKPENVGDCCFAVDVKEFAATVKALTGTCVYGIKSGDKDMDFGDDGSGVVSADSLMIFADEEKQILVLKYAKFSVFATAKLPAQVFAEGVFVVPSAILMAITYRGKDALFTLDNTTVHVKSANVRTQFQVTGNPDDVEALKPEAIKCTMDLGADFVKSVVQKIMFASTDSALPSYGMPLHLKIAKSVATLVAHDNICAAAIQLQEKQMDDMDVVLPGSALVKAVQACGAKVVRLGVNDSYFRVSSDTINVYHPLGTYDLFDVMGYMEKDVLTNKPELVMSVNPVQFYEALSSILSVMKLQSKAPGLIEIKVLKEKASGRLTYHNDVISKASSSFDILDAKGTRLSFDTDGPRLLQFLGGMRTCKSVSLRLYDGRIFLTSDDNVLSFVIPER